MMFTVLIECTREDDPSGPIDLIAIGQSNQIVQFPGRRAPFPLESDTPLKEVVVRVEAGGYWILQFINPIGTLSHPLTRLGVGPEGWWHALHSPRGANKTPLRIGVIDEALPKQRPDSPLAHVKNFGGAAWRGARNTARAYVSQGSNHGVAVCNLLTARPTHPEGLNGIVPDADVLFCAAGSDTSDKLNPVRLYESIKLLVAEGCDLITFSAGDGEGELPLIELAMARAAAQGVLCFAAAGNRGGEPLVPARYANCYAVGAVGLSGQAPPGTSEFEDERRSHSVGHGLFLWCNSASGPKVSFMGAGVGVVQTQPDGRTYPMTGTSAAAPIVAGIASIILGNDDTYQSLARDKDRVNHALSVLSGHCILQAGAKFGLLVAP